MNRYPRVCYEIFVRSFADSDNDGIGDLKGIISRLDYLGDLGVEGIWLTPVHPSPSYHKYNITDYYSIDPEFGTTDDFKELLAQAHRRGIRIYMDLVIHHTSTEHPWFLEARKGPGNPFRSYYRWLSPRRIRELGLGVRELTQDAHAVNPWHPIPGDKERFYGIFCDYMADLDFDCLEVREEVRRIATYWLAEMGVDGFRLDAARHIFPIWEEYRSAIFWEEFGRTLETIRPGVYTVGEVWESASHVAPYFRGLKANFNFDLCFALRLMLLDGEDPGLVAMLKEQYKLFAAENPEFVDAIMLSNHDLERIGSLLEGHRGKLKLAASILLTLPGQPYLYYGDELGMKGRKPDPFLREPFLWGEAEEKGDTRWMEAHYNTPGNTVALKEAQCDPYALYYHYKALIALRRKYRALGLIAANLESVDFGDREVLAYLRTDASEPVVVIHNLSDRKKRLYPQGDIRHFNCFLFRMNGSARRIGSLELGPFESMILKKQ